MYFLRVETNFSAALYLSNCDDLYKGMHGHDYKVLITLRSSTLTPCGMVYDYNSVQETLSDTADKLDHILLNDQAEFLEKNPTLENIAKYFYDTLLEKLPDLPLYQVDISQLKGISASYRHK